MMETYFQRYIIQGGILMVFLVPCAFLCVAYMIQSAINLRKKIIIPNIVKKADEIDSIESAEQFLQRLSSNSSPFSRIFFEWRDRKFKNSINDSERVLKEVVEEEVSRIYHKNNQLLTIYQVAPLLGLLGTVLGMMKTFYQFAQARQRSIEILSIGINEALITTLWGLSIAIPAFTALHFIKQKLFRYEVDILPKSVKNVSSIIDKYVSLNPGNSPQKDNDNNLKNLVEGKDEK